MRFLQGAVLAAMSLLSVALAAPSVLPVALSAPALKPPRLVLYHQTTHDKKGNPISILPLICEDGISLTHLIVASFHINEGSVLTLNDYPPTSPLFRTLWNETKILQEAGVRVMGMIGGAAAGSFTQRTLDTRDKATWKRYYGQLRAVIKQYGLNGLDIDVEQPMSQLGISRLILQLRKDFGQDFEVSLAPVASALTKGANLSGFNYTALEQQLGDSIAFYNVQFYNGFGHMYSTHKFDRIMNHGWDPKRIVIGQLTHPIHGSSYVPFKTLKSTFTALRKKYGTIGGVMGWEYFHTMPGGLRRPWRWAQAMTEILQPKKLGIRISPQRAATLIQAWWESRQGSTEAPVNVDYMAMVNTV
ncbi:endo-N-acetyl-beta-D-glucosaminidase precursor [Podospora australis]|uniref:chitinase n=1 Tax=Podospora australis TaxID=1536484 RepID=A0AAN6WNY1_9PEZI|nr:endo-N-acetyl-beta-D-glucosaminidase precursor [Podospora australis]